uniref:Uncharacterized protein n=1 Tax=Chlamydomonas leiostraca TaxID=1034604 RepID=A0A7S0RHW6_9CHLO
MQSLRAPCRPFTHAKAAPAARRRTVVVRAQQGLKLYVPGTYENQVLDILMGTAMQAQQAASCYNNCLATSVALVKATQVLGLAGFTATFGHLGSTREGVNAAVPHVWVQYKDQYVLDATLSDVLPTEELFKFKSQLKYIPGRAENPMPNVGLPKEADSQDKLEYWVDNMDEYLMLLARADANTPQAAASLLCHVLPEALAPVKDDLLMLLQQAEATTM